MIMTMTLDEYKALPIDIMPKEAKIGQRFRVKSEREYNIGDIVWYFEVIKLTEQGFEYSQMTTRLE
jgi:hypothetical protein